MTLTDRAKKVADGHHKRAAEVYQHALNTSARALDSNPPPQPTLDDADEAMAHLEGRFDGIKQVAHVGPKRWSDEAKKTARKEDNDARKDAGGGRARRAAAAAHSGVDAAAASRYGRGPARVIRRGIRDTGIPQGTRSATRTALNFVGAGFGLSIMYLLLTNADRAKPGQAAVELFAKGLGRTAQVLVSPAVDPLSPNRTATKPIDLSRAGAAVASVGAAVSTATGAPVVPGVTPLLADPAVVATNMLAGVHLPHLARPYTRPPTHVRQPPHAVPVH